MNIITLGIQETFLVQLSIFAKMKCIRGQFTYQLNLISIYNHRIGQCIPVTTKC